MSHADSALASAVQATFEAFLAAHADPAGGERLYALHAPDAWMLVGGRPARRAETSPEAFAGAHRELLAQLPADATVFGAARLASLTADADRVLACFQLHLAEAGEVPVWVGLVYDGQDARLVWTAHQPTVPTGYAHGLALMLSHFPFLDRPSAPRLRSWLEVACWWQYRLPRPELKFLPGARFSCQGSGHCCKYDWSIRLPAIAQDFLDAIPWETVRPELAQVKLPVLPDGQLELKERGKPCRFLSEQNQCLLHQHFGSPVFGPCSVFPFHFSETPEGVAVTTSYFCGAARDMIGLPLEARKDDLYVRLALQGAKHADDFRVRPGVAVGWDAYQDAEQVLRQVLGLPGIPLRRRLYMGVRILIAWRTGEEVNLRAFELEPIEALDSVERMFAEGLLEIFFSCAAVNMRDLPPLDGFAVEDQEIGRQDLVVRWFENILFSKELTYAFDLTTAFNTLVLLYLVLARFEQSATDSQVSEAAWRSLTSFVGHGGLTHMLETIFEEIPEFREQFGSASFGQLMLRFPAAAGQPA